MSDSPLSSSPIGPMGSPAATHWSGAGPICRTWLELADEAAGRFGHEIARELHRLPTKSANRLHDLQQISTIARPRRPTVTVIALVQEVDALRTRIQPEPLADAVEDLLVDLARRRLDAHL